MITFQQFPLLGFGRRLIDSGGSGGTGGVGSVTLQQGNYEQYEYEAPIAVCTVNVEATGQVTGVSNNTTEGHLPYAWLLAGAAADYDLEVTLLSGTFSFGTVGSRLSLGTNRVYRVSRNTVGSKICSATFTIRNSNTDELLVQKVLTLTATRAS